MDTLAIFRALNEELKSRTISRNLIICGGAALIALKIVTRGTKDVDVLAPKIDQDLNDAAEAVAALLKLDKRWLNNGPASLVKELPDDWESHCTEVFQGSNLVVRSIGRRDLIYSKLYAAADRTDDIQDLVELKPTEKELDKAAALVLQQDASEIWPKIVEQCVGGCQKETRLWKLSRLKI